MIEFRNSDPFPFLELGQYSYEEAKVHSHLVDEFLGFNCERIESSLHQGARSAGPLKQNWQHLSVQAMQTPYIEIRNILELISPQPNQVVIDLGAAYGRMAFILARHFSRVHFKGFEIENSRVLETQRVLLAQGLNPECMCNKDLTCEGFQLPEADFYFIFDYGHEKDVRKTLKDLQNHARRRSVTVIARGRLTRALIHSEHPWLCDVHEPRHFSHFSIYRS